MPLTDFITRIDVNPPKIPLGSKPEPNLRQDAGSERGTAFSRSLAEQSRRSEPSAARDAESRTAAEPEVPSSPEPQTTDGERRKTELAESTPAVEQRKPADDVSQNDDQTPEIANETTPAVSGNDLDHDELRVDDESDAAELVPSVQPLETEKAAVLTPPAGLQILNREGAAEFDPHETNPALSQAGQQKPAPPQNFLQTASVATFTQTDVTSPATPVGEQIQEAATPTVVPELAGTAIDVLPEVDPGVTYDSESQQPVETVPDPSQASHEQTAAQQTLAAVEQIANSEPADEESAATTTDKPRPEINTIVSNENDGKSAGEQSNSDGAAGQVSTAEVGNDASTTPAVESTSTAGSEVSAASNRANPATDSESTEAKAEDSQNSSGDSSASLVSRSGSGAPAVQAVPSTADIESPVDIDSNAASDRIEAVDKIESGALQGTVRVDTANRGASPAPAAATTAGVPVDPTAPESADRVARMVQTSLQTGRPLRVRLNPPELGTLQIEVAVRNGVVTARLDVQNASARQIVLDNLSSLQESLSQNGSTVNTIEVHLSDFTADDQSADSFADWNQQADSDLSQDLSQDENRHSWETQTADADDHDSPQRATVQKVDRLDIQV